MFVPGLCLWISPQDTGLFCFAVCSIPIIGSRTDRSSSGSEGLVFPRNHAIAVIGSFNLRFLARRPEAAAAVWKGDAV